MKIQCFKELKKYKYLYYRQMLYAELLLKSVMEICGPETLKKIIKRHFELIKE